LVLYTSPEQNPADAANYLEGTYGYYANAAASRSAAGAAFS
jgi:hypothetical protein